MIQLLLLAAIVLAFSPRLRSALADFFARLPARLESAVASPAPPALVGGQQEPGRVVQAGSASDEFGVRLGRLPDSRSPIPRSAFSGVTDPSSKHALEELQTALAYRAYAARVSERAKRGAGNRNTGPRGLDPLRSL